MHEVLKIQDYCKKPGGLAIFSKDVIDRVNSGVSVSIDLHNLVLTRREVAELLRLKRYAEGRGVSVSVGVSENTREAIEFMGMGDLLCDRVDLERLSFKDGTEYLSFDVGSSTEARKKL